MGLAAGSWVCAFVSSSTYALATAAAYEVLVTLPAGSPAWSWPNVTTAVPASASPSAAPTPSASPTPGPAAAALVWVNRTTAGRGSMLVAGAEGAGGSNVIYVCRGVVAGGDVLPGKWEAGWLYCDIPLNGVEVSDVAFAVERRLLRGIEDRLECR